MKAIEQTSLALLSVSLVFLALVAAAFAFDRYATQPPIYIPQLERKDFSYVKSLTEATSLEGVKKICTFWAEREDESRKFTTAVFEKQKSMVKETVVALVLAATIFSVGLRYIYLTARRLQRVRDAL
jgi:hypothetical protein